MLKHLGWVLLAVACAAERQPAMAPMTKPPEAPSVNSTAAQPAPTPVVQTQPEPVVEPDPEQLAEQQWLELEQESSQWEPQLKKDLGPSLGPLYLVSFREAIAARDAVKFAKLTNDLPHLRNSYENFLGLTEILRKYAGGYRLALQIEAAWDGFEDGYSDEAIANLKFATDRGQDFVNMRHFPDSVAGLEFGTDIRTASKACYDGMYVEAQVGLQYIECAQLPVSPNFAVPDGLLTFLDGKLVSVTMTSRETYKKTVGILTNRYGEPNEFGLWKGGKYEYESLDQQSFAPGTLQDWALGGGRIRVSYKKGTVSVFFIHDAYDVARARSF